MVSITDYGQDILSSSTVKSSNINPFSNIKTSVFFRYGSSDRLGLSKVGGIEVRKFVSLQKHIFAEISYASWINRKKDVANKNYDFCSYTLTSRTVSGRLGMAVFGGSSVYFGGHYLLNSTLNENIPSVINSEQYTTVYGDITPFIKRFIPHFGLNMKIKLWQVFFLEMGAEAWFDHEIFEPLKGNWRIPDGDSPLLSETPSSNSFSYVYMSIHIKL